MRNIESVTCEYNESMRAVREYFYHSVVHASSNPKMAFDSNDVVLLKLVVKQRPLVTLRWSQSKHGTFTTQGLTRKSKAAKIVERNGKTGLLGRIAMKR